MNERIAQAARSCRKINCSTTLFLVCGLLASGMIVGHTAIQPKRRVLSDILLPSPQTKGSLSLEEVLAKRRSVREFTEQPLAIAEIGQLMWAAQGITDAVHGFRTAPSAGAKYPLEIYVVARDGLFHYLPQGHRLERLGTEDLRQALAIAAVNQDGVRDAAANFVIACVLERTAAKYGDRAERYVQLEAGHAAQNILLQATALGLGGVSVGAMSEEKVKQVLSLPPGQAPLYIIAVGHPR